MLFDRDGDGNLHVKKGGGSSKPRLLTCSDYTGLEIMRVLKDEVLNQKIQLLEFCAAVELTSDEKGHCTGAIFKDLDNHRYVVVAAKSVILATGGIGRLHIQGFPTSNHYGATGDGLCLSYRMGAKLMHIDTFQYHPSGAVYPRAAHRGVGDGRDPFRRRTFGQCEGRTVRQRTGYPRRRLVFDHSGV